jgi:lipoprotein-anchoring transpeptidase ErfK/SrfK
LSRIAREPECPGRVCCSGHRNDAHHPTGQHMSQHLSGLRSQPRRATHTLISAIFTGTLALAASALLSGAASAQVLGYASAPTSSFPSDNVMVTPDQPALSDDGSTNVLAERLRRAVINLDTREAPGTVIIDTGNTALYYVLGNGQAIRYGVGVGREGFTWAGTQTITRKAEWPDWHPPAEMIARQPYLPRFMAGGPGNPLGARAMYLGSSEYRIHGTNDPTTIGKFVSSGCIRLTNEDVADLFSRVDVGTKVVVLAKNASHIEARAALSAGALSARTAAVLVRPAATARSSGREAMNVSGSSIY